MEEISPVEKGLGGPLGTVLTNAAVALTPPVMAAAELAGNPIAMAIFSVIPALHSVAFNERLANRSRVNFEQLNAEVAALRLDHNTLSDDQVQFTTDTVAVMFSTVSQAKLEYLRRAVVNSLSDPDYVANRSAPLARLVRDIAPDELLLLRRLFHYKKGVAITEKDSYKGSPEVYAAAIGSEEEIVVTGLIRLGLLNALAPRWGANVYEWSPLVAKLLAITASKP